MSSSGRKFLRHFHWSSLALCPTIKLIFEWMPKTAQDQCVEIPNLTPIRWNAVASVAAAIDWPVLRCILRYCCNPCSLAIVLATTTADNKSLLYDSLSYRTTAAAPFPIATRMYYAARPPRVSLIRSHLPRKIFIDQKHSVYPQLDDFCTRGGSKRRDHV